MLKEAKELIGGLLEDAIDASKETVMPVDAKVEYPASIDNYILSHPYAALLIIHQKSVFADNKMAESVAQERDMMIGVIVVSRKILGKTEPEELVDFVFNAVVGTETDCARGDRRVTAVNDELLKEENGVWWYGVTVRVPGELVKS